MSNETRLKFLLTIVKKVPVENKIKFFRKIGFFGTLANLKQILPLNQYVEEAVRITARGASLKIILRAFENDREIASLDIEIFKEVLEQLERDCDSMTEADFADLERLRERIQKTAGLDYEAEKKVCGCSHAETGQRLLEKWKLSETVCEAIGLHHSPDPTLVKIDFDLTGIIHLSDNFTRAIGIGNGGDNRIPRVHDAVAERYQGLLESNPANCFREISREMVKAGSFLNFLK
jgi:HDOD domain